MLSDKVRDAPAADAFGKGIGGLTLALYLHASGIPCRVYEAAAEFKPLGVGINLFPHAMRRLFELGLGEAIARVGVEAREFTFFNQYGQLIFSEPCGRYAGYDFSPLLLPSRRSA